MYFIGSMHVPGVTRVSVSVLTRTLALLRGPLPAITSRISSSACNGKHGHHRQRDRTRCNEPHCAAVFRCLSILEIWKGGSGGKGKECDSARGCEAAAESAQSSSSEEVAVRTAPLPSATLLPGLSTQPPTINHVIKPSRFPFQTYEGAPSLPPISQQPKLYEYKVRPLNDSTLVHVHCAWTNSD